MSDFRHILKAARIDGGYTQKQLANLVGVSQGAVRQWEAGETRPTLEKLVKVAYYLQMNLQDLISEEYPDLVEQTAIIAKAKGQKILPMSPPPPAPVEPVAVTRRIPVVGLAAAAMYDPALSQICDLWDASDETVPCVIDRDGIFAVRIQGDSMEPDLHDGDVVAVDPNTLPATGDTAIICLRTEGLVIKRWHWRNGIIRLESLNPSGKTYQWTKDEVHQQGLILWRWKVLGVLWHKF